MSQINIAGAAPFKPSFHACNLLKIPITGDFGELYLGGPAVNNVYFGNGGTVDEDKNQSRFSDGIRLIPSGDLVCCRENGVMEVRGRRDAQVKIRGHRVDPGEIERILRTCEWVTAAVVSKNGNDLVAHYTGKPGGRGTLRAALLPQLPAFMVPNSFIHLKSMPRTVSGKIDRPALARLAQEGVRSKNWPGSSHGDGSVHS